MDDSTSLERRPGGTVEPLKRAAVAKSLFQAPPEASARRYELRDPFADVTYRSKSFDDMVAKADQLGAIRFTAVAADGTRSTVTKAAGNWAHDPEAPDPRRTWRKSVGPSPSPTRAHEPAGVDATAVAAVDAEADRRARLQQLDASLSERYLIKRSALRIGDMRIGQTEYRHRGDPSRIAFTESTFRLSTDTDSPSVARSMVDVAEARNWQGLRVTGSEEFRRLVWLEASARGVRTVGYEPVPGDLESLRKAQESRQANRIERTSGDAPGAAGDADKKGSTRGGGRKAVLAAIEAVLVAKRVPEAQRVAVMVVAAEQLARRTREGEVHRVKVYDRSAPPAERVVRPAREPERAQERTVPAR